MDRSENMDSEKDVDLSRLPLSERSRIERKNSSGKKNVLFFLLGMLVGIVGIFAIGHPFAKDSYEVSEYKKVVAQNDTLKKENESLTKKQEESEKKLDEDKKIIDKLIEASKAGVRIEMVIRGINCIQSGIAGKTDHIRVISIVGRYLEHSRIYFFGTGEREQVYIASADFMTRNTLRRVEVAVPIKNEALRDRLRAMFRIMLEDNVKARVQLADGSYRHVSRPDGEEPLNSQEYFFEKAYEAAGNLNK